MGKPQYNTVVNSSLHSLFFMMDSNGKYPVISGDAGILKWITSAVTQILMKNTREPGK